MNEVTGASRPITLGEKTFNMSPLSDREIVELDHWLQARYLRIARQSLGPDATNEDREMTIALALKHAARLSVLSGEGAEMMSSVEGLTHLLFVSIRKNHPDLKEGDLSGLLLNPANVIEVNRVFSDLNHTGKPPRNGGRGKGKKRQTKKKSTGT